jgi:hypothetical protein
MQFGIPKLINTFYLIVHRMDPWGIFILKKKVLLRLYLSIINISKMHDNQKP